jgi:hypothetical protein
VEQETARRADAGRQFREKAAQHVNTTWDMVRLLPESVWLILVATVFLLPLSYFVNRALAPDSNIRFIWTWAQIVVGVVAIFAAQVWAFVLLRRREEPVVVTDIFLPGNLWRRAVHGLPETGGPFSLCAFAFVAILTAILWIGRWGWLLTFDSTPDLPTVHVTEENRDFRADYKKLKEAATAAKIEREKPLTPPPPPVDNRTPLPVDNRTPPPVDNRTPTPPVDNRTTTPPVDNRPTTLCVVIGYVPGENGRIDGLVLATLREGTLTFAGTVSSGLGKTESAALAKRLGPLTSKTPLVSGVDVKAVWVKPEVFCEVHQSGATTKGQLIDPRFKAVITDE